MTHQQCGFDLKSMDMPKNAAYHSERKVLKQSDGLVRLDGF